jgi:hypothetical protein
MTQINVTLWQFNVQGGLSAGILLCFLLVSVDRARDILYSFDVNIMKLNFHV